MCFHYKMTQRCATLLRATYIAHLVYVHVRLPKFV
jgi:hypothetical protein